ncbi:hypothetical protein [Roseateles sp.]|uniref:hypothetical protein n=1 Tax=Roseateles sp. TaxID=1971397 RepID=UPI00326650E8
MIAFERSLICAVLAWLCLLPGSADARTRFESVPAYVKSLLDGGADIVSCSVVTPARSKLSCEEAHRLKPAPGAFVFGFVRARGPDASEESTFAFILRASPDGSMAPAAHSMIQSGGRWTVFESAELDAPSDTQFRVRLVGGGRASEPSSYDYTISLHRGQWVVAHAAVLRIERCSEDAFAETEYQLNYLTGSLRWSRYENCKPAPARTHTIPPRVVPLARFELMDSGNDPVKYMGGH